MSATILVNSFLSEERRLNLNEVKKLKVISQNELRRRILNWFRKRYKMEIEISEFYKQSDQRKSSHMLSFEIPHRYLSNSRNPGPESVVDTSGDFIDRFEKEALKGTNYIVREVVWAEEDYIIALEGLLEIEKKPEFLYHGTSENKVKSILKQGLKPRPTDMMNPYGGSAIRSTQPRVYLTKTIDEARNWGVYVIEIDVSKFNRFNLFSDPSIYEGDEEYFTLTHIPPRALKQVYPPVVDISDIEFPLGFGEEDDKSPKKIGRLTFKFKNNKWVSGLIEPAEDIYERSPWLRDRDGLVFSIKSKFDGSHVYFSLDARGREFYADATMDLRKALKFLKNMKLPLSIRYLRNHKFDSHTVAPL